LERKHINQTLVIQEKFYTSLKSEKSLAILKQQGFATADLFMGGVIARLNAEYNFFDITGYRFQTIAEIAEYSQYGAFIDGKNDLYEKIVICFTPIVSKLGNVIIAQSIMPVICNQMEQKMEFLLDNNIKKIVLLTSQINQNNKIDNKKYNTLQMDINSLNTLNFDVIPFFKIKNLSTDSKFNTLDEYIEMSSFLQKRQTANAQTQYLQLSKNNILVGDCEKSQIEGQFLKWYCFKFLTAIFSGGDDYKYDISKIISKLGSKIDNQFRNLKNFIDYANKNSIRQVHFVTPTDEDIIESDDEVENINDAHRLPEKGLDTTGRKRYKTQKKIRDTVLANCNYLCNCNDLKHFYFEATNFQNYVECHHIIPMNRQEEYWFTKNVNLDIPQNIVALCPNCHSQIHLGSRSARLKIISELYVRNKAQLLSFDPDLTLSLLASYYNIGLDSESEEEKECLRRATQTVDEKQRNNTVRLTRN
jgi:hypothetical protein